MTAIQDFSISGCRIAGSTTGISLVAAAGAVTKAIITGNTIGPTGGIAGNTTGINIAAGTYGMYFIYGNNVTGNTTNINDAGSVTAFTQKVIRDNVGALLDGGIAATTAASAAINTTETIVVGGVNVSPLPANSLQIGSVIEATLHGTCTSTVANTSTFRIRIGTAGTTSDGVVLSGAVTAAASGTTIAFDVKIRFNVRTLGAAATIAGDVVCLNNGVTGIAAVNCTVVAGTASTFNSTVNNYIEATYVASAATTTCTFQACSIEVVR